MASALNKGLRIAQGKYIARMDADDISFPNRIATQVQFMEVHEDVGVLGTTAFRINEIGKPLGKLDCPLSDLEIRWWALLRSPMIHPTVMLRAEVLKSRAIEYNAIFYVEDYDLWTRLLEETKFTNLPTPLLYYRVHSEAARLRNFLNLQDLTGLAIRTIRKELPDLKISDKDIYDLVVILKIGLNADKELICKRATLTEKYIEMWISFSRKYSSQTDLEKARNAAIMKSSKMLLYPIFQRNWLNHS